MDSADSPIEVVRQFFDTLVQKADVQAIWQFTTGNHKAEIREAVSKNMYDDDSLKQTAFYFKHGNFTTDGLSYEVIAQEGDTARVQISGAAHGRHMSEVLQRDAASLYDGGVIELERRDGRWLISK